MPSIKNTKKIKVKVVDDIKKTSKQPKSIKKDKTLQIKRSEVKQRQTKFIIGKNNPVVEALFPKGAYSKSDIVTLTKNYRSKYKDRDDLKLLISVNLPDRGWRSAKQFGMNDEPSIQDLYDDEWEESNQFAIYFWKAPKKEGGCDNNLNDCLFNCLKRALNKDMLPKDLNTPESLKKRLGLRRKDKISIKMIPEIEKLYKVKNNVTGSHTYTSASKDTIELCISS